ncbi:MAG: hypothetical protein B7Y39_04310 [Bdellovibrio sp. 28-41-41]|nr:MAG: hypothetical protein B7Y39_04310 [Bdellovibrio sp. 28-41-41]
MYFKSFLFCYLVGWGVIGLAQSSDRSCENLTSYKGLLLCAVDKHPDALKAKLLWQQNQNLIGMAEQRPNPEINSQVLSGKAGDDSYQYTQINLAHTFELGGKRDARIRRSQLQMSNSELDLKLVQEQVYLKTYLALARLRQIQSEMVIYDDALNTFERIQKQYRSRPRMTPEQKAIYAIMDIAASDYRLKRQPLLSEIRENERFIEIAIGRKFSIRKELYPPLRKKWPILSPASSEVTEASLSFKKSLSDLELAQAEVSEANSQAWSDLKLGPTFETQSQGSQKINSFGLNLSFALPVFHTNGAGKSYAEAGVSRAKMSLAATKEIENQQWNLQREKYQDAVKSLESALSFSELEKKHREVEDSFSTGIIPSSLVIEIHRQMADYTKSLSEQENATIEALANIYSIEGRLLSEGL